MRRRILAYFPWNQKTAEIIEKLIASGKRSNKGITFFLLDIRMHSLAGIYLIGISVLQFRNVFRRENLFTKV